MASLFTVTQEVSCAQPGRSTECFEGIPRTPRFAPAATDRVSVRVSNRRQTIGADQNLNIS